MISISLRIPWVPSLSDEDQDIRDLFIESINAHWELAEAQMSLIKSVLTSEASHTGFSPHTMMHLLIFIRLYAQEKASFPHHTK